MGLQEHERFVSVRINRENIASVRYVPRIRVAQAASG
jgi:hypothetical protein